LNAGNYVVDVISIDGAGNVDPLEAGRNHFAFRVSKGGQATVTPPPVNSTPTDNSGLSRR
jgi:hypothetical protein